MRTLVELALFTDDLRADVAFYRALLGAEPLAEWSRGAIFSAGDARILLHTRVAAVPGGPPNEDHVAFAVAELDATCATLEASGLTVLLPPADYPWGRSAYLRDPDGRLVELAQG